MATLVHAVGALPAVLKLDWARNTEIVCCVALTWKADGTSAGLASTFHQATLWCCLQPTCLAQRKGCKGRCPHLSLPSSASCVRPKWSQKERETMLLPQNLQHVSMQIGSQNLGLFPFLLLMKIDRPVAPLQWLASGIVHSRNSL